MIVDVREKKGTKVSGYRWSDGGEYLRKEDDVIELCDDSGDLLAGLCYLDDLDNFIKALKLAKEMK